MMDRAKVDYKGCLVVFGEMFARRRGVVVGSEYVGMNGGAPDYRLRVEVRPGDEVDVEMVGGAAQVLQWPERGRRAEGRGPGAEGKKNGRMGERENGSERAWRRPAGGGKRVRQGELL